MHFLDEVAAAAAAALNEEEEKDDEVKWQIEQALFDYMNRQLLLFDWKIESSRYSSHLFDSIVIRLIESFRHIIRLLNRFVFYSINKSIGILIRLAILFNLID